MSHFFCRIEASLSPGAAGRLLAEGRPGGWWIEGLGPIEVRGEARVGRLLIAHGAGAGQDSAFMQRSRDALAEAGVQTLAIEFAYLQRTRAEGRRRPPPRAERLVEELAAWCDLLSQGGEPLPWFGGKSLGGRVASLLATERALPGLVLFGYPFHPPGKPERRRLDHWPRIACPILVLQGTRDPFGSREEVTDYALPARAHLHWLEDGDHDWKPRRASGLDQAALIERAAAAVAARLGDEKTR